MGIFSKKVQIIPNEDYEKLSNRLSDMQSEIKVLKTELETLRTNQNSLRGLVNRKMGKEDEGQQDLSMPYPFKN